MSSFLRWRKSSLEGWEFFSKWLQLAQPRHDCRNVAKALFSRDR
jgi:hypothetical protein